ncbi:uncharacterized protein LOC141637844 [Silene latifolia]|uniref:uncharacterized protein LOC141637844 n=1 Tax=Silene latifolia TaxID=37657 RepID=UPI003D76A91F
MALKAPSIICLKSESNKKYLRCQKDTNLVTHDLMQFSTDNVLDPYIQIEVVKSEAGDDLFHLKSRYNNKFLTRWLPERYWISASADRPNEDQNSWTCTLFKPTFVQDGDTTKIRLKHVHHGCNLLLWSAPNFDSYLIVGSSEENDSKNRDVFNVLDWKSMFESSQRVAFQHQSTNQYLGTRVTNGIPYQLRVFNNIKDTQIEQEIFRTKDGILTVKNVSNGKFWRVNDQDWIVADLDEDPRINNNLRGMFRLNRLTADTFGLVSMSKKWYCKIYNDSGIDHGFRAATQDPDSWAHIKLVDLTKVN